MDLWSNPDVRFALFEFALKLVARGAVIRFPRWTRGKGIDDYLAVEKDPGKALEEIESKALSFEKFISSDHQAEIIRALKLGSRGF